MYEYADFLSYLGVGSLGCISRLLVHDISTLKEPDAFSAD